MDISRPTPATPRQIPIPAVPAAAWWIYRVDPPRLRSRKRPAQQPAPNRQAIGSSNASISSMPQVSIFRRRKSRESSGAEIRHEPVETAEPALFVRDARRFVTDPLMLDDHFGRIAA